MKGAVSPVFFQSLVGWSQFIPRPDRKPAHCRPSFAPLLRQSVSFQAVIGQQDVNCIDEKEKPKRDGDDTSRAACSHHDPRLRSLALDSEVQVERGVFHGPSPDDAADHQTASVGEQCGGENQGNQFFAKVKPHAGRTAPAAAVAAGAAGEPAVKHTGQFISRDADAVVLNGQLNFFSRGSGGKGDDRFRCLVTGGILEELAQDKGSPFFVGIDKVVQILHFNPDTALEQQGAVIFDGLGISLKSVTGKRQVSFFFQ